MRLFALTTVCFLLAAPVCATQYVGVKFGTHDVHITNNDEHNPKIGFKTGLKYGYAMENGVRTELEVDFAKNEYKTDYSVNTNESISSKKYRSFKSWSYMANIVYDFAKLQLYEVTPFLGVGVGYCETTEKHKVKFPDATYHNKERDGVFAYQGIVGLKYLVNAEYSTTIEYKYFCGQSHMKAHSVGVSLLRNF